MATPTIAREATRRGAAKPASMTAAGFQEAFERIVDNASLVIKGKESALRLVLTAMIADGHCLLEDMPGTGKTMMARALSTSIGARSNRIQCTPDLLPSDVTGAPVLDVRTGTFSFREGPVFANVLLVDEINRATPKTQSALLEAMQERNVTLDGVTHKLPTPFLILATQNPVEQAGTFQLPEAQLDRFLVKLTVPLPERADEVKVLEAHNSGFDPRDLSSLSAVASAADLEAGRAAVAEVTVAPEVIGYVVDLCRATRSSPSLQLGASPRGATALLATSKAWAWLSGRDYVTPDDVKALARPTLRHRVSLRPEAELEGASTDAVLEGVLATVPVPR